MRFFGRNVRKYAHLLTIISRYENSSRSDRSSNEFSELREARRINSEYSRSRMNFRPPDLGISGRWNGSSRSRTKTFIPGRLSFRMYESWITPRSSDRRLYVRAGFPVKSIDLSINVSTAERNFYFEIVQRYFRSNCIRPYSRHQPVGIYLYSPRGYSRDSHKTPAR